MKTISFYGMAPVEAAGWSAIVRQLDLFRAGEVVSTPAGLAEHLRSNPPDLLVVDGKPVAKLEELLQITSVARPMSVILWMDSISTEFLWQALRLGVIGVLVKHSTMESLQECLTVAAEGQLWIERDLNRRLLSSQRIALTPRERQIMGLVAQGLPNKLIAWSLGITLGTVKVYMSRLYDKVGVGDRFELALMALRNVTADHETAPRAPHVHDGVPPVPFPMPEFLTLDVGPHVC